MGMEHAVKTGDVEPHELLPCASLIGGSIAPGRYDVEGVTQTGEGSGATFRVIVSENGLESIQATRGGKGYQASDLISLHIPGAPEAVKLTIKLQEENLCWNPSMDREPLFYLDCRHTRIVRWSGLKDEGRVVVSIRRP